MFSERYILSYFPFYIPNESTLEFCKCCEIHDIDNARLHWKHINIALLQKNKKESERSENKIKQIEYFSFTVCKDSKFLFVCRT